MPGRARRPPGPGAALGPVGLLLATALVAAPAGAAGADPLSPAQRRWVQQHQPRLGAERDYGPFVFQDADGRLQGLSIELLQLVQQRTGLRVRAQPAVPLHQLLDAARAGQIDLVTSLRASPERAAYLLFTRPYVSVPAVLVHRAGAPPPALSALAGRPVAVGRGYAVEAVMRRRHPEVAWQPVSDDARALQGLADGEFDAAVADIASVAHILRSAWPAGAPALQVGPQVGFDYTLSFAVRRDWPELQAVLDAGILALDPGQRQAVVDRWLAADGAPLRAPRAPRATALALGLLAAALLVAVFAGVRRRRGAAAGNGSARA